jgi:hypothetical protein
MAMVDIQSLFQDIIETPRQRQQAMQAQGQREAQIATNALSGRSQIFAPLVGQLAASQGMRDEMLQRSVGGLFGLDTRNESEKVQQMLSQADTATPEGQQALITALRNQGYGAQAAQLQQQMAEQARALEDRELARQAQQQQIAASQSGMAIEQAQEQRTNLALQRQQYNREQLTSTVDTSSLPEEQKRALKIAATSGAFDNNPDALLARLFPEADSPWQSAGGNGSRIFNKNTGEFLFAPADEEDQDYQESFNTLIQTYTPQSVSEYFNAVETAADQQERNAAIAKLERVPTGRVAAAEVEQEEKTLELNALLAGTDRITSAVAGALAALDDAAEFRTAGQGPAMIRAIPGQFAEAALLQPERNLRARIDQLKADIAFERLQQMREESPTGGALGNVSNIELGLLQSTLGNLDTTQSPEQLRETLNNVQRHYVNFLKAELGILPEIDWDSPVYRGIVRKVGDTVAIKRDANDPNSWEIVVTQENPANVR